MRSIPDAVLTAMDEGRVVLHAAHVIENMDSPSDGGVWSGHYDLTVDGVLCRGLGATTLMAPVTYEVGVGANGVSVNLASTDTILITTVLSQDLRNRFVTIYALYFDQHGTTLLHTEAEFYGTVDQVLTRETPAGEALVTFQLEGEAQGSQRGLGRLAADQDQKKIDPADTAFRRISTVSEKVLTWFGKEPRRAAVSITS